MDKLTAIKIKYEDGTYSDQIPVSVLGENVEWDATHTLVDILGSIDVDITGTIQDQITQLFNSKVNATDLNNYVNSTMKTEVASWLNNYISPATGTIAYDASLSIQGAAADAKAAGQIVQISTTKPTKENNRIWVGASEEEYEVPTMDEFNDLKADLYSIANQTYHPIVGGRIYNAVGAGPVINVTPQTNAAYAYLVVPVTSGDTFVITGTGNTAYRPWALTDADYKCLVNSRATVSNETVKATINGYLVCTFLVENTYSIVKIGEYEDFKADVASYETSTDNRFDYIEDITGRKYANYVDGSFINLALSGGETVNMTPISYNNISHIVIPCRANDVFFLSGQGSVGRDRAYAFISTDYKMIVNTASAEVFTRKKITAPADGYLVANTLTNVSHSVVKQGSLQNIIYVDPNATPSDTVFNTITDAIVYANDNSNTTILVASGDYDIIDELGGSAYTENLSGTSSYAGGLRLGNNTTIKGLGSGAKLIANYLAATNQVMTDRFSIFNIVGSFVLENIEMEVTNVRYCVHEDMAALSAGDRPSYYKAEYKNCKMKHNGSSSTSYNIPACIGGGTMNNSLHVIDGCFFDSPTGTNPASYHNNATTNNGISRVVLKDSYFANNGTMAFTVYQSNTQVIEAEINGCRLGNSIIDNGNGLFNITEWNNTIAV